MKLENLFLTCHLTCILGQQKYKKPAKIRKKVSTFVRGNLLIWLCITLSTSFKNTCLKVFTVVVCIKKNFIHKYQFLFQSIEHIKYNTNHIFLQVQQRDDYTCLLNRIEELADIKDGEAKQYVTFFISSFMYFLY